MPSYSYKASTFEGKIVEGTMEALDDGTVSLKLQEMGLLPVQIGAPARQTLFRREIDWPWRRRKIRRKDLLVFTQELQTLVHAGFPLDRSLAVLGQRGEPLAQAVHQEYFSHHRWRRIAPGRDKPAVHFWVVVCAEACAAPKTILRARQARTNWFFMGSWFS